MKTVITPVVDWRRIEQLDVAYARQYWAEMLLATGSWCAAISRAQNLASFLGRQYAMRMGWLCAWAVTEREEIESLSVRINQESNTEPLPGMRPEAARSAAPA